MNEEELSDQEYLDKLNAFKEKNSLSGKSATKAGQELYAGQGKPASQLSKSTLKNWESDITNPPGPVEIAGRGALSGISMGFQPQIWGSLKGMMPGTTMDEEIEREKARNEQAFQSNKLLYGTGYGAGALGLGAATAGLGNAIQGTRIGAQAVPYASKFEMAKDFLSEGIKGVGNYLGKSAVKPTPGKLLQGAGSVLGSEVNQPKRVDITPRVDIMGSPISQAEQPDTPFSKLQQFLASSNIQDSDEDIRRKVAMQLASSPQGRSITNTDSEEA